MNRLALLLQVRDIVPSIETGTATSVMGWGGFVFGLIACLILVWDRVIGKGRAIEKMDKLIEKIEDVEARLEVVDGLAASVRELIQEWRGAPGSDNGYRRDIRENTRAIAEIVRRNDRLDAIREEDERRSGGQHRRLMDRELNNLLPEKREGRP